MTDLFYTVMIAIALLVMGFTAWVSSEGYVVWQMSSLILAGLFLGVACVLYAWREEHKK